MAIQWEVRFAETFEPEFDDLPEAVQNELLARAKLLEAFGPDLGRPYVDTLNGSKYPNMKELRFGADDGVWRVAFAFDPERAAILLVAGDKAGVKQQRFYKHLIRLADLKVQTTSGWNRITMARSLSEKLNSLPAARREQIEARAAELIDQEMSLRELRKALDLTQTALAAQLKVGQDTVSRLERRTDMLLSTLSDYVRALGGELELNVEFPGRKRIRLKTLHEPAENNEAAA